LTGAVESYLDKELKRGLVYLVKVLIKHIWVIIIIGFFRKGSLEYLILEPPRNKFN